MFSLDLFKTYFDIPYLIQSFALFKEWLLFTGRKSRWRTTKNNAYIPAKCRNDCLGRSTSAPRCQCQRRNWSVWKISSVERWCSGVFLQFTVKIEDECVLPNEKLYKKTWHTLLVCCKEELDGVQPGFDLRTEWLPGKNKTSDNRMTRIVFTYRTVVSCEWLDNAGVML